MLASFTRLVAWVNRAPRDLAMIATSPETALHAVKASKPKEN